MDLASAMAESKLISTDWIYENIFHFSQDQYDEMRDLVLQDQKRKFRLTQLEAEGNDPIETGKSYGTPHDLASLYGRGRYESNSADVPTGYDEKEPLGRPEEKVSDRNTQNDNFGKDRLGSRGMKKDDNESDSIRPQYKGGSPLAMEAKFKSKALFETLDKKLSLKNKGESLLDESNIKEQKS
jgi:hypothetical protein